MNEVHSEYEHVDVESRTDSKKFCDEYKSFNTVFNYLTAQLVETSREVNELSEQLGSAVGRMALNIRDLGALYKKVHVNS